jgi:hypothetical protein
MLLGPSGDAGTERRFLPGLLQAEFVGKTQSDPTTGRTCVEVDHHVQCAGRAPTYATNL